MSRFYKIRVVHTEIHNRREVETFIIRPEKNIFDSFMTEICARLPELFYQPFKLYYADSFGEFITIFNWLDFGIFFMQNISDVYLMKIDTKTNLHFRTLWSTPMPTARRSSTYDQFMQPAYQLSQQTCFDFLRSEHNQGQKCANDEVSNMASTEQQKTFIDFSAVLQGVDMANSATNTDSNKVSSSTTNSSATENTTQNIETDFNKTAINTSGNDTYQNVNTNDNQNISNILLMRESNKNSLIDGIELHERITEDNKFEKLEVETPNDFNIIENTCDNVKVPKKRGKGKKWKSKIEIVEPAQIIGEPITEWTNDTFSLGDNVEVCAGDWIGLKGKITAIDGEKVKVIPCIDGVEVTKLLKFKACQLCIYGKANQNEEKIVSLDEKEPTTEVVQSNDNNENVATTIDTYEFDILKEQTILDKSSTQFTAGQLCSYAEAIQNYVKIVSLDEKKPTLEGVQSNDNDENVATTIDTYESNTLKEEIILDESSTQFTAGQLCSYTEAIQNYEKIVSLDEKEPTPEGVQSNDNNNENVGTTIDTYESDTLKEETILDESSTQLNVATSEGKDDDNNLQKLNILTKYFEDAIIEFRKNTINESCDSMKLISIEDTESSIEPEVDDNFISIESGQESPTSREWTFVESAEYAERLVTVDMHVTGTIPKKTISKEDINHDTVRKRILPEIPVCNAENVASSGHIAEALSIMTAMGFSNDGDQLFRLLESVDGNISSALDLVDSVDSQK